MHDENSSGSTPSAEGGEKLDSNRGGYSRPPKDKQFKPGRPANPRGRPRGARGRKQVIRGIAGETHAVVENGKRRRRTTLELVLLSLRNQAAEGNVRAFRAAHELLQQYGPEAAAHTQGGFFILPEELPPDEWEQMVAELRAQGKDL